MTRDIFEIIVEKAVKKAVRDTFEYLSSKKEEYQVICILDDSDEKKVEEIVDRLHNKYEYYKNYMKDNFFNAGENNSNRIDIHKIGSCLTASLIDVRIFKYRIKEQMDVDVFLSNYMVAFLAGMHLIYLNMVDDYTQLIESNVMIKDSFDLDMDYSPLELLKKLEEQHTIIFPKTNIGHDSYAIGRIKSLALNDVCKLDFDLLNYADMLFWIEEYNKQYLVYQLNKKSYIS